MRIGSLFLYVSMGSEVDTRALATEMFDKTDVYVPYTAGGTMRPVKLWDKSDLLNKTDKLGNLYDESHPAVRVRLAPPRDFTVTIVPMLAFDSSLHRLGYGGGYYDKFLENTNTVKIGLAYDEQELSGIDFEEHDIALDVIVTPTRVIGGINGKKD